MLTVVIRRDRGNALTVRNGFAVKETGTLIRGFTMRLSEFVGSGLLRQTLEKANVPPSLVEQIIRLCSRPNARLIVKAPEMYDLLKELGLPHNETLAPTGLAYKARVLLWEIEGEQ